MTASPTAGDAGDPIAGRQTLIPFGANLHHRPSPQHASLGAR
jgi:hypothetical protein